MSRSCAPASFAQQGSPPNQPKEWTCSYFNFIDLNMSVQQQQLVARDTVARDTVARDTLSYLQQHTTCRHSYGSHSSWSQSYFLDPETHFGILRSLGGSHNLERFYIQMEFVFRNLLGSKLGEGGLCRHFFHVEMIILGRFESRGLIFFKVYSWYAQKFSHFYVCQLSLSQAPPTSLMPSSWLRVFSGPRKPIARSTRSALYVFSVPASSSIAQRPVGS